MLFEYWTTPGRTHIKAILESGDSKFGVRQEGKGTPIELKETTITYDYQVSEIHPDILGLICMVNFYPFIGTTVTFPKPVSSRLKHAFSTPWFKKDKAIFFTNIDDKIPKYSGEKISLSFGGGIDSTAVSIMFPEAYIVHESHLKGGDLITSDIHNYVESLSDENGRVVVTNQRYMSKPGGWHSWPCSTATSLLLATDMQFGIILIGAPIGATMLFENGLRYWDRHRSRKWHGPAGSHWQSTFQTIGIPMFSPIMGVTEIQSMHISLTSMNKNEVSFCIANNGKQCSRCKKCLRRDIIRSIIDTEYSPKWSNYDVASNHDFLEARPLYMGHIFAYALNRIELPGWITSRLEDISPIESEWPNRIFTPSFDFCPEPWRKVLKTRVMEFIEPMTGKETKSLKQYHLMKGKISPYSRVKLLIKPDQFIR